MLICLSMKYACVISHFFPLLGVLRSLFEIRMQQVIVHYSFQVFHAHYSTGIRFTFFTVMGRKKKEIHVSGLPEPWKAYYSEKKQRSVSLSPLWINLLRKIGAKKNNIKIIERLICRGEINKRNR